MHHWAQYVDTHATTSSRRDTADSIGVDVATVNRWREGVHEPDPAAVIAFARAHQRPVLEALAAAGWISDSEADITVVIDEQHLQTAAILHELAARADLT